MGWRQYNRWGRSNSVLTHACLLLWRIPSQSTACAYNCSFYRSHDSHMIVYQMSKACNWHVVHTAYLPAGEFDSSLWKLEREFYNTITPEKDMSNPTNRANGWHMLTRHRYLHFLLTITLAVNITLLLCSPSRYCCCCKWFPVLLNHPTQEIGNVPTILFD